MSMVSVAVFLTHCTTFKRHHSSITVPFLGLILHTLHVILPVLHSSYSACHMLFCKMFILVLARDQNQSVNLMICTTLRFNAWCLVHTCRKCCCSC